jgi:hypothetical protein
VNLRLLRRRAVRTTGLQDCARSRLATGAHRPGSMVQVQAG